MTEIEEIKAMMADINKKLDKIVLNNKIVKNTAYGRLAMSDIESEYPVYMYIFRHKAIKDFILYLKSKSDDYCGDTLFKYMKEFESNDA